MGWAYGAVVKLNDEFQMVSVVYTEVKSAFNFTVFSLTPGETTFEVKDIKVTATPPPELTAADIPGKLFIAHEMPARHGKVQKIADAHDGKAVWGKRYYHVITLPVPANENDLYYYCHVRKDSEKSMAILLKNVEQTVAYGKLLNPQTEQPENAEKNKEFFVNTSSVSGAANFAFPFTEFCNVLYTKLSKMRYDGFSEAQKAACIEKMLSDADKNGADGGEAKKKTIKEALDNFDNLSKDDLGKLDKLFSAVVATLAESDMKGTPKKAIRSSISLDKLSPEAQKEVLEFVGKYSKENIDKVREVSSVASYIEHARWEMYMASEGYIYGDSTVKPLKMHSNMVTTEYLTLGDSIKDI
jgi:hypothetical protein